MMCHTKLINNAILFFFRRENGLQSKALFLVKISFLPFDFILYNVISQLNLNRFFLQQCLIKFLYRFSDKSIGNGLHYILHYHEFVIYVGVTYTNVYIRIAINCLAQTRVSTFLELYIFFLFFSYYRSRSCEENCNTENYPKSKLLEKLIEMHALEQLLKL